MMKLATLIKTKKEAELGKSLGILALAAMLIAVAVAIGVTMVPVAALGTIPTVGAMGGAVAVVTWVAVFVGGLFYAWLIQLLMQVLGGKGKYVHGLATVAYPALLIAIGVLISVALMLIPLIGGILAFVVMTSLAVVAYAMVFRLLRLLFEVDLLTAFIAIVVLAGGTMLAIYITILTFYITALPFITGLLTLPAPTA
jgi:hypothetical protein